MEENQLQAEKSIEDANFKEIDIQMSDIYDTSSLKSEQINDFESFLHADEEFNNSVNRSSSRKQKRQVMKQNTHNLKPYSRNSNKTIGSVKSNISNNLVTFVDYLPSPDQVDNHENNIRSVVVKHTDGATTEVTLQPVIMMHVREIPLIEKEPLSPLTPLQSLCRLGSNMNNSTSRVSCSSRNEPNIRVKLSSTLKTSKTNSEERNHTANVSLNELPSCSNAFPQVHKLFQDCGDCEQDYKQEDHLMSNVLGKTFSPPISSSNEPQFDDERQSEENSK